MTDRSLNIINQLAGYQMYINKRSLMSNKLKSKGNLWKKNEKRKEIYERVGDIIHQTWKSDNDAWPMLDHFDLNGWIHQCGWGVSIAMDGWPIRQSSASHRRLYHWQSDVKTTGRFLLAPIFHNNSLWFI